MLALFFSVGITYIRLYGSSNTSRVDIAICPRFFCIRTHPLPALPRTGRAAAGTDANRHNFRFFDEKNPPVYLRAAPRGSRPAQAQTFRYRLTHEVDSATGERRPASGELCMTFAEGRMRCYESDRSGKPLRKADAPFAETEPDDLKRHLVCDGIFRYHSNRNGSRVYVSYYSYWSIFPVMKIDEGYYYAVFSPDFGRLNIRRGSNIYIGERVDAGRPQPPQRR